MVLTPPWGPVQPDIILSSGRSPAGTRDYLVGAAAERVVRRAKVLVLVVP